VKEEVSPTKAVLHWQVILYHEIPTAVRMSSVPNAVCAPAFVRYLDMPAQTHGDLKPGFKVMVLSQTKKSIIHSKRSQPAALEFKHNSIDTKDAVVCLPLWCLAWLKHPRNRNSGSSVATIAAITNLQCR
jgi:hypothetical protein